MKREKQPSWSILTIYTTRAKIWSESKVFIVSRFFVFFNSNIVTIFDYNLSWHPPDWFCWNLVNFNRLSSIHIFQRHLPHCKYLLILLQYFVQILVDGYNSVILFDVFCLLYSTLFFLFPLIYASFPPWCLYSLNFLIVLYKKTEYIWSNTANSTTDQTSFIEIKCLE